jgi:hypothetical protein
MPSTHDFTIINRSEQLSGARPSSPQDRPEPAYWLAFGVPGGSPSYALQVTKPDYDDFAVGDRVRLTLEKVPS